MSSEMSGESIVGTISAFAGQISSYSGAPNNIWKGSGCSSQNSTAGAINNDVPMTYLEANGWMFCDGRTLDSAVYPELFSVIGYLYGKTGAGSFNLPDYRGLFLRGVDAGSGMDPDSSKRLAPTGTGSSSGIGSFQCDALQTHTHTYKSVQLAAPAQVGNAAGQSTTDASTTAPDTPARITSETRPKNIAVNYIIKFR